MKYTFLILFFPLFLFSQLDSNYAPTLENPFGKLNPGAPIQVVDYAPLIGICDCTSTRIKQDQTWGESQKMEWTFKYIMNGTAVQDESIKEDGTRSGSIRQYVADSSRWYVHWYSNKTPPTTLPTWEGNKKGDDIVLYKERKAPNGMDGFYRLSFKNFPFTKSFKTVSFSISTTPIIAGLLFAFSTPILDSTLPSLSILSQ